MVQFFFFDICMFRVRDERIINKKDKINTLRTN